MKARIFNLRYSKCAMRINPLLVPLMAVLTLPFALGVANTVSMNGLPTVHPNIGPGGPLPKCASCSVDVKLQKQQNVADLGCAFSTSGADPYIVQTGYCQRYQCTNGFYYSFGGWTTTTTCASTSQTATACPTASCSPG